MILLIILNYRNMKKGLYNEKRCLMCNKLIRLHKRCRICDMMIHPKLYKESIQLTLPVNNICSFCIERKDITIDYYKYFARNHIVS